MPVQPVEMLMLITKCDLWPSIVFFLTYNDGTMEKKILGYPQDGCLLCDITESHQYFNLNFKKVPVQNEIVKILLIAAMCAVPLIFESYFLDVPSASLKCCRSGIQVG